MPEVKEKLSYNVPFFRVRKTICFIWPGAVPWGKTFEGVQFGFIHGYLLSNEDGFLATGKRKYVRIRTFKSIKEIDFERLRALLYEAVLVDSGR
ncbi:DUF1801 domain-containing protein [Roseivirga sp.]|uniref:DUF1801 domain-containing protein n=1 Tax=Roseivirga sp. TaxID=1964215 RepID=UPI003B8D48CD